jgi:hypothetical protein
MEFLCSCRPFERHPRLLAVNKLDLFRVGRQVKRGGRIARDES